MPLILGTNSIKDTGYDVANSLRFDDGSSDTLSRTPSSTGNRKTWTFSCWYKRGNIVANSLLSSALDGNNFGSIDIDNNSRKFSFFTYQSGTTINLVTSRVFRDVSSWYSIIIAVDTTQGTASNRVKLYINGVQETAFDTSVYPSQNLDTIFNVSSYAHRIGVNNDNNGRYLDGYLSEVVLVDGTAQANTDLGEFDEDSGIWKPIDVSGLTFGTNGFYLDFENSGSLGADVSGNGNNFTVNNLTSIDQTTDTPTNNFATMNPLAITNSGNTFSEGNLKITTTSGASSYNQATIGVSTGKWFWEVKYVSDTDGSGNYARIGIADIDPPSTSGLGESEGIAYEAINGRYKIRGSATTYGDTYAPGDIIGVALNLDDNELIFYKNGTAQNSGTAIDISSYTPKTGFWHPAFNYDDGSNSGVFEINFGSPPYTISSGNSDANGFGNFEYSVPSGYFALCTKNLAEYG
ncbi:hypothetical protein N8637_01110 [Verrucomicrobia bacterium]|nr:hypothetical protein [Verrucomicrobiota bacterium]